MEFIKEFIKGDLQGLSWEAARQNGSLKHLIGAREFYRVKGEE